MDRSDTYHDTSLTIRYVSRYFKYRRLEVQNRFIQGTNCILVVLPLYFNEVSHNLHMTRPFSSPHTFLLEHRHPKYLPDSRFAAWGSNQLHPTFGHLQHFLFSLSFSFLKNTDLNEEIFFTRIYLAAGIDTKGHVSILVSWIKKSRCIDASVYRPSPICVHIKKQIVKKV